MKQDKSHFYIPLIYIVMMFVSLPVYYLLSFLLSGYMLDDNIFQLAFYMPTFLLLIIFFIPFWKHALADAASRKLEVLIRILKGFGIVIVAMIALGIIYQLLQIPDTSANQEYLDNLAINGTVYDKINLVLFTVLFAPLVEEMVFRYAVFGILRTKNILPINVVITISAFLFGFLHTGIADLVQIFYYAGMGAILGYIYYRSNNLIVPIAVHMLYNLYGVIGMLILYG